MTKSMPQGLSQDDFFNAIENGDTAHVEYILQAKPEAVRWGIEVNAGMKLAGGGLRTGLHQAAIYGRTDIARALMTAGADIEAKDKGLSTPLIWAAGAAQADMVALLLDHGADPNMKGSIDTTPLMCAAGNKGYAAAELLIKAGADLDAAAGNGATALHWASEKKDLKMLQLLIMAGADETKPNIIGFRVGDKDDNLKAFVAGCAERRAEKKAFIQNQIDMVKNGSAEAVAVRRPLKLKSPGAGQA